MERTVSGTQSPARMADELKVAYRTLTGLAVMSLAPAWPEITPAVQEGTNTISNVSDGRPDC
jgi:hypothetical protein